MTGSAGPTGAAATALRTVVVAGDAGKARTGADAADLIGIDVHWTADEAGLNRPPHWHVRTAADQMIRNAEPLATPATPHDVEQQRLWGLVPGRRNIRRADRLARRSGGCCENSDSGDRAAVPAADLAGLTAGAVKA